MATTKRLQVGATVPAYPTARTTGNRRSSLVRIPEDVTSGDGWVWNVNGYVVISGDDTVFSGYQVAATINVSALRPIVRDNVVEMAGGGGDAFGIELRHCVDALVEHNTVSAIGGGGINPLRLSAGAKDIYFDSTGTKFINNNFYGGACGIHTNAGVIVGNYVHDMGYQDGDHTDCILSSTGSDDPMVVRHNTLINQQDQTAAVALYEDNASSQMNKTIEDNFMAGGGYVLYCGGGDHGGNPDPPNMIFRNNKFSTIIWPNGGQFGPVAQPVPSAIWEGNVWADGPNEGEELPNPSS